MAKKHAKSKGKPAAAPVASGAPAVSPAAPFENAMSPIAEAPDTEALEAQAREMPKVYFASLTVSGALFALFVIGVYLYATFGGPVVEALSSQIGETLASQAKTLRDSGDIEGAVRQYREALQAKFRDARQRDWALYALAELLVEDTQPEEAVLVLRECLESYPDYLKAHALLCTALHQAEQYEEEMAAASTWYEEATRQNEPASRAQAKQQIGAACEAQGDVKAALQAYLASVDIEPTGAGAYHAAVLLSKANKPRRAAQLLDAYIPKGSGWRLEAAKKLRAQLP